MSLRSLRAPCVPVLLVCGVGWLAGCSSSEPTTDDAPVPERTERAPEVSDEPVPEEEETADRPTQEAVHGLLDRALRGTRDMTYAEVVRALGRPNQTSERPVRNEFTPGQVDTVRTLSYPDIEAQIYRVSGEARSFLIQMRLLGSAYVTPEGLRVGQSPDAVRQEIGAPDRVENGTWVYEEIGEETADLRLVWVDNALHTITYVFHFS